MIKMQRNNLIEMESNAYYKCKMMYEKMLQSLQAIRENERGKLRKSDIESYLQQQQQRKEKT